MLKKGVREKMIEYLEGKRRSDGGEGEKKRKKKQKKKQKRA